MAKGERRRGHARDSSHAPFGYPPSPFAYFTLSLATVLLPSAPFTDT